MTTRSATALESDPLWYKDAIIYQIHPRGFFDGNDDGAGDFSGLTQKLDYLQDLGVTALWILPFYPSPWRDDGYDISDYCNVHPAYGTLQDFRRFLREAHRRGLRVITELVINHTSDQHHWFQMSRQAKPADRWRSFYVWSDTPEKYKDARIIFKDFEPSNWSWDPVAGAYFWHRFYAHQPDLNFESPHVRRAVIQALNFWLRMGVDGLRLDAIPYLYEREGTSCENLPETHAFLKSLRRYVDEHYQDRMFLAEANQWPEDAVAYFGNGDECHTAFHFPVMPRLFMATRLADRYPIIDILGQTPAIPEQAQWVMFLRNHDELTLEMVTDEERDYMYRVYARDRQARINLGIRRRLAPLLENDRRKIELLNSLLFSMPGTPVLYYGDEIGMGDNFYLGDRNGVRTPMQWSADRNAGFSRANPQQLYLPVIIDPEYHYESINVEAQQKNPNSLLWWMKRMIALRKRFKAFGRGSMEFLFPDNNKVLVFVRRYQEETVLVVANLSRYVEYVELDLSGYRGMTPVELIGRRRFPPVGEHPYVLSLGPYASYWFSLEPQRVEQAAAADRSTRLPTLTVAGAWKDLFQARTKGPLEAALPEYLQGCHWFMGRTRTIQSVQIVDAIPLPADTPVVVMTVVQVEYTDGEPETYSLPLTYTSGEQTIQLQHEAPQALVARLSIRATGEEGMLCDAMWDNRAAVELLQAIDRQRRFGGRRGEVAAAYMPATRPLFDLISPPVQATVMRAEQKNTSVVYRDQSGLNLLILKLFRRIEPGVNPDLEVGRFLTERKNLTILPPVAGVLEYRQRRAEPMTLAILNGYVANEGDAWQYTQDALRGYFDRVLASPQLHEPPMPREHLLDLVAGELPPLAEEFVGPYLEVGRLLGQRTGELHVALASAPGDPHFGPEPSNDFSRRSHYQATLNLTTQALQLLRRRLSALPAPVQQDAERVLALEEDMRRRFRLMVDRRIAATRIRCHGDYHLGQVLNLGRDFMLIDFEGEASRPISQRKFKASPLRDVAGMTSSFHYAAYVALLDETPLALRPEDVPGLEQWAKLWYLWVSTTFLQAYLDVEGISALLPRDREHLKILLDIYLLEKALYEVDNDLKHRPNWVKVPLTGILQLLASEA